MGSNPECCFCICIYYNVFKKKLTYLHKNNSARVKAEIELIFIYLIIKKIVLGIISRDKLQIQYVCVTFEYVVPATLIWLSLKNNVQCIYNSYDII